MNRKNTKIPQASKQKSVRDTKSEIVSFDFQTDGIELTNKIRKFCSAKTLHDDFICRKWKEKEKKIPGSFWIFFLDKFI